MGSGGLEPFPPEPQSIENTEVVKTDSASDTKWDTTLPDKQKVINTLSLIWDSLPDAIKAALVALLETAYNQYAQPP
ncbi:MAG: hypothetical protein N2234_04130 [Planctomycetota bacterium]|nr:hypothetical protein [Planctomycetota bacterium]